VTVAADDQRSFDALAMRAAVDAWKYNERFVGR
jgi:hypothetical protein